MRRATDGVKSFDTFAASSPSVLLSNHWWLSKMRLTKFTIKSAQDLIPRRKKSDNKSTGGKSLIIAGSEGMFGAAVLTSTAASRVGSGYVILFTSRSAFLTVEHPSFMVVDSAKKQIPLARATAIAIGPGLGNSAKACKWVRQIITAAPRNVVIDADALTICSKKNLWPLPKTWLATPHEGELARILSVSANEIRKDRRKAIVAARKKMGCIVVLKGSSTLVLGDRLSVIEAGNSALAKAGTGDVLTGVIVGLLAQGLAPEEAACLGVFIHGSTADDWVAKGNDHLSLMPEDLLECLPKTLKRLR